MNHAVPPPPTADESTLNKSTPSHKPTLKLLGTSFKGTVKYLYRDGPVGVATYDSKKVSFQIKNSTYDVGRTKQDPRSVWEEISEELGLLPNCLKFGSPKLRKPT